MRATYRVLANLIALGVVLQASAVALGVFLILNDVDDGGIFDKNSDWNIGMMLHSIGGMMVIPLLAIVLFIVSFFSGVASGVKWAGFVLLAVVVQVLLAFVAFGIPGIGALHAINAFVVLGLALQAGRMASASPPTRTDTQQQVPAV